MASLADIPPDLVDPSKFAEYEAWLLQLQIEAWLRKELLFLWARATNYPVTNDDVIRICGTDI